MSGLAWWQRGAVEGGEHRPRGVARGCCGAKGRGRITHPIGELYFTLCPHPLHQVRTLAPFATLLCRLLCSATLRTLLSRTLTFLSLFAKVPHAVCRLPAPALNLEGGKQPRKPMKPINCYIIEVPLQGSPSVYCAYPSKAHATRECAALNVAHWSASVYIVVECAAWNALDKNI